MGSVAVDNEPAAQALQNPRALEEAFQRKTATPALGDFGS
jgi:hypothetical protein